MSKTHPFDALRSGHGCVLVKLVASHVASDPRGLTGPLPLFGLFFLLLACLSERSVMYEEMPLYGVLVGGLGGGRFPPPPPQIKFNHGIQVICQ